MLFLETSINLYTVLRSLHTAFCSDCTSWHSNSLGEVPFLHNLLIPNAVRGYYLRRGSSPAKLHGERAEQGKKA